MFVKFVETLHRNVSWFVKFVKYFSDLKPARLADRSRRDKYSGADRSVRIRHLHGSPIVPEGIRNLHGSPIVPEGISTAEQIVP